MTADAKILRALRTAALSLSVSELATQAGLTPDELEARIAILRGAGYEIELVPHLGYRMSGVPDRLIADDLSGLLSRNGAPLKIAREILVFEETGSTNDVAARLARAGTPEGLVVFAERQTAGRGRLGRRWDSAARKGLWFSLLLRPALSMAGWSRLTTWAALGVARGLEEVLPGCRAAIKWPNDVYLSGRKAVGILIESAADSSGNFAIVGIGVNVNQTAADFPEELAGRATSLRLAAGGEEVPPLDRQEVATALLRHLDTLYDRLDEEEGDGFSSLVAEAETRSCLLGQWVEIAGPAEAFHGIAEGLEPDGSLRVRREDGTAVRISGGEVTVANWQNRA